MSRVHNRDGLLEEIRAAGCQRVVLMHNLPHVVGGCVCVCVCVCGGGGGGVVVCGVWVVCVGVCGVVGWWGVPRERVTHTTRLCGSLSMLACGPGAPLTLPLI